MNRIPTLEPEQAPQNVAALYDAVTKKLGLLPNMVKALGNSSAALQGYLGLSGAVSGGRLKPSTREKIALLVAEENSCDYCLSAHTAIGGMLKIPASEIKAARHAHSDDDKEQALLGLAKHILNSKGDVSEQAYSVTVSRGVSAEEATEVVANVAVNVFTNYFNRFAQTEIDFPKVESAGHACACAH